jgi:hypothetical protein
MSSPFMASGRLRVIVATPSATWSRTGEVPVLSPALGAAARSGWEVVMAAVCLTKLGCYRPVVPITRVMGDNGRRTTPIEVAERLSRLDSHVMSHIQ